MQRHAMQGKARKQTWYRHTEVEEHNKKVDTFFKNGTQRHMEAGAVDRYGQCQAKWKAESEPNSLMYSTSGASFLSSI